MRMGRGTQEQLLVYKKTRELDNKHSLEILMKLAPNLEKKNMVLKIPL
ncbi:hypothetical protein [Helcococcus kunzii]|nr:hypothetical protein [Helcococcus kunzii]